jgi:DNA invertase Pin-like site-specific DNA recombinase
VAAVASTSKDGPRDYYGYVRVSQVRGRDAEEKKDRFHSPDTQLDRIKDAVESVDGRFAGHEYDPDKSGYQQNVVREGWDKAVAWVMEDPKNRGIVAYDTSRLGRNLWKLLGDVQHTLVPAGARVIVAGEGIDTASLNWELQLQITGLIAEQFSRKMGERWDEVHARRIANKQHPLGKVPYGYRRLPEVINPATGKSMGSPGIEPDPENASVVRRMYRMYLDGQGLRSITQTLNDEGVPSMKGNGWSTTTVGRLLSKRHYLGEFEFKGEVVKGGWEPIIDQATWDDYSRLAAKKSHLPNRSKTATWTLAGIAKCGLCGANMTVNYLPQVVEDGDETAMVKMPAALAARAGKPKGATWSRAEMKAHQNNVSVAMCTRYRSKGKGPDGCLGVYMRRVALETQFTYYLTTLQEQVAAAATGKAAETREVERSAATAAASEARAELEKASDSRANLALLKADGDINEPEYRTALRRLEERVEQARSRLATAEAQADAAEPLTCVWEQLATAGEGMSTQAWNQVLKRAVGRVEVNDDTLLIVPTIGDPVEWERSSVAKGRKKRRATLEAARAAHLARMVPHGAPDEKAS